MQVFQIHPVIKIFFAGYNSGDVNSSGERNTFVGGYSGSGNTTGFYNTFLGSYAGYDLTTSSVNNQNVILGGICGI